MQCVDLGGRRIIKKNFFKQKTAYEISECLVGSEMCIRDRNIRKVLTNKKAYFIALMRLIGIPFIALLILKISGPVSYTHLTLPTICSV